jgi:hypothetical protein
VVGVHSERLFGILWSGGRKAMYTCSGKAISIPISLIAPQNLRYHVRVLTPPTSSINSFFSQGHE